jgi:type VI secretion system protein ImpH
VIDDLIQEPSAFDFFHAVRLLQRHWRTLPRVGYAHLPKDEAIRFKQTPTLAFSPTLITDFLAPADGKPGTLALSFHGLLGVNGPLPTNYTEYAIGRMLGHRDTTLVAFLDIFHHRMMSFLARAWADNNIAVDLDRPEDSRFVRFAGSFIGIEQDALRNRDTVPDFARLYFTGWLGKSTRCLEGLEKILQEFFSAQVQVQPFQGRWLTLPVENQSRLGESLTTGILGESVILGRTIWDCRISFRIRFGPVSLADFRRMLPGSPSFERLRIWVREYLGIEYFWDLQLVIIASEIPCLQLGGGARLGYDTWLQTSTANEGNRAILIQPRAA